MKYKLSALGTMKLGAIFVAIGLQKLDSDRSVMHEWEKIEDPEKNPEITTFHLPKTVVPSGIRDGITADIGPNYAAVMLSFVFFEKGCQENPGTFTREEWEDKVPFDLGWVDGPYWDDLIENGYIIPA